jgi:beta-lactamase regulating signal transducer with metallopeptidase domain
MRIAEYTWFLGAALLLTMVLIRHRRVGVWVRSQTPLKTELIERLLAEASQQLNLRRPVSVIVCATLSTPAVFGIARPRVLIPRELIGTLNEEELRLILLHELTHVKRQHVFQNWLLLLVQSVHWFNPTVWFACRRLRFEREIVCDRAVVRRLEFGQRNAYGATLIKVAQFCSTLRPAPTLVPILTHKQHIRRRLNMITKYKSLSRAAAALSALVVVALGCFLLTGAERTAPRSPAEAPKEASPDVDATRRGIEALERELERLNELTRTKQREVDELKLRLGISELEEASEGKPDPGKLRRLQALHVEAVAQYETLNTLYSTLTNLTRRELLATLSSAAPDQQLQELQSRFAAVEQKYAEGIENAAPDHPDNKKTRRLREQVEQQLDDRIDAVMQGMRIRANAQKANADRLSKELQEARDYNISHTIQQRPYFEAKRDLETLRQVRDEIWRRLLMERVDAKLPRTTNR